MKTFNKQIQLAVLITIALQGGLLAEPDITLCEKHIEATTDQIAFVVMGVQPDYTTVGVHLMPNEYVSKELVSANVMLLSHKNDERKLIAIYRPEIFQGDDGRYSFALEGNPAYDLEALITFSFISSNCIIDIHTSYKFKSVLSENP